MSKYISLFLLLTGLIFCLGTGTLSAQDSKEMMDPEMMDKQEMMMEKVNINTADMEQLMKIPGVGEGTAKKIIDYRNSNGQFKTLDQLKSIQGIGEKKYEKMKDMITM